MIAGRYCCGLALLCCSLLITGCPPAGSTAVATRISTVDPLTEPEFDSFAGRIASKLAPLAQTGSRSISLGSPQLVVDDEANRPAARYFSYALMDGLTDRMGGTLTFGRAATEAVQYRTVLLFNRKAQTVEFVVTDANGQREVVRESAHAAEQPAVAATREPAEVAAVREPAAVAVTPPSSPPPAQPEPPPPPAAEPPVQETADASLAPPEPSAQAARPVGRPSARTVKPGKIKIDAPANEIGAQVLASLELLADRTTEGPSGRTILLDSDTVRRFAVLSQRAARNPRGQLQVQIAVLCKKGSDLEYRVVFLDEAGQPVSATGVLNAEFETGERKRFTITAGDARAASYVCLLRED